MFEKLVLTNVSTQESITLDVDDSEFVLGEVDFGSVPGTHHTQKFFNQIGVYIENTTLEAREPSIQGWVTGDTYDQLKANKAILNRLVNPMHYLEAVVYDKYKLEFKPSSSIKYSVTKDLNNEVLCKFLIQGTCSDPLFSLVDLTSSQVAYTAPKFKFPLVIPRYEGVVMGVRNPDRISILENSGDIESGLVIRLKANGSVLNPQVINVQTQEYIKINKEMSSGETILISTVDGKKRVRGMLDGEESNYFGYWDFGSSWMKLSTGVNYLTYTAESGLDVLDVAIEFTPRFLEVQ